MGLKNYDFQLLHHLSTWKIQLYKSFLSEIFRKILKPRYPTWNTWLNFDQNKNFISTQDLDYTSNCNRQIVLKFPADFLDYVLLTCDIFCDLKSRFMTTTTTTILMNKPRNGSFIPIKAFIVGQQTIATLVDERSKDTTPYSGRNHLLLSTIS